VTGQSFVTATVTDAKLLPLPLAELAALVASTCGVGASAARAGRPRRASGARLNAKPWNVVTPIFLSAARRVIRS
jgi:hypothetical protein